MKITLDFIVTNEELEKIRKSWQHSPEGLAANVEKLIKNKGHLDAFYLGVEDKIRQRLEEDAIAANPDLEAVKGEIVRTLYLYNANDKHNRTALYDVLQKLDPSLARRVKNEGPDAVYSERFADEEDI